MTVREHMALAIEAQRWRYLGAKEAHIAETLGWTLTRHAQVVSSLISRPDVEAAHPTLVRRLQRLRDARREWRTA